LRSAGYTGLLAIEIDFLHPRYKSEDRAVARSVRYLSSLLTSTNINHVEKHAVNS
jgi:hypothetical protein